MKSSLLESEATRWHSALSLYHLFPHSSLHLLVSVVNDATRHQLPAASVFQPCDENDDMSIQSSKKCRAENPVRLRDLQHLVNLVQEILSLQNCTLRAFSLQRRYFSAHNTACDSQRLYPNREKSLTDQSSDPALVDTCRPCPHCSCVQAQLQSSRKETYTCR